MYTTNQYAAPEPMIVESAEEIPWDDSADVVVVGFGGAGAVASIQARECGVSVIAVERFAGGGATAYSGGIIYAGGTRFQREAGYDYTAEEMYKYLTAEGSAVEEETLKHYCKQSSDHIEWLSGFGISYGSKVFKDKTAYPPDGYYLYFSGNETMPKFAAQAKPAPRGHRPTVPGFGGQYFYDKLFKAALEKGVILMQHTPVSRLVLDRDGRAVGVEVKVVREIDRRKHLSLYKVFYPWRPFNSDRAERANQTAMKLEEDSPKRMLIRARRGVILATGGYNNNLDMLSAARPIMKKIYKHMLRLGSLGGHGNRHKAGPVCRWAGLSHGEYHRW